MKKLLFFIAILGIGLTGNKINAQTGWSLQTNPIPPSNTNDLGKVQFVSSTEGWISAPNGDLLHTTDAGSTWNRITPFPNDTVSSMADPANSMSWVNQSHGWKINFFGTNFSNTHGAVVQKTTDGGVTWTKKVLSTTPGDAGFEIQFVDELNGRVLIYNFSTGNAQFLKTTDGGNNWSPFNGAGMFYFVDSNNGWSYTGSGLQGAYPPFIIYHTTNGGTNWTPQNTDNNTGSYYAIQFTDLNNGWIVGDSSKVLKTTNGGVDWTRVTNTGINSNSRSKCLFFLNGNTGWIGTNDGIQDQNPNRVILHTTNGGASWAKEYPPISNAIFSISFWDENNGWFTGSNCVQYCDSYPDSVKIWQGAIGHTSNGGVTGVEENQNLPSQFSLSNNYPNPWNPTTTINYSLAKEGNVKLSVYNTLGSKVAIIVNEYKPAGNYSVQFNGSNLASGIYLYRLESGNFSAAKKFILMK